MYKTTIKGMAAKLKKNNNISEDNNEDYRTERNKNIDNNCPKFALVGAILFIIAVLA